MQPEPVVKRTEKNKLRKILINCWRAWTQRLQVEDSQDEEPPNETLKAVIYGTYRDNPSGLFWAEDK